MAAWLSSQDDDEHLQRVADIIESRAVSGAGVGVLCPTNRQVADLAHQLRMRGLMVSEEGAGSAASIPAVAALLDLLRFASHPGDRAAAYRVSHSPFAASCGLVAMETIDRKGRSSALEHAALAIRQRIGADGLGEMIADLVGEVGEVCDAREQFSLRRVAERAAIWDLDGPRDVMDFVRIIEQAGFGSPSDAPIRLMTQHKAKGLEFDEVVLPWLDGTLAKVRTAPCYPLTFDPLEPAVAMAPGMSAEQREHAPVLEAFQNQGYAASLADALSLLYVSVTRPRLGLHLVLRPSTKDPDETLTPATLLRAAIPELNQEFIRAMDEGGDQSSEPFWTRSGGDFQTGGAAATATHVRKVSPVRVRIDAPPRVVSPSAREQSGSISQRWPLIPGRARRDGFVLHELFRLVRWLEDGTPDAADVERAFDEAALQLGRPIGRDLRAELQCRFERSLEGPLGDALRRQAHAAWAVDTLEAIPEHPMLVQTDSGVIRGRIDRLVIGRNASGTITRAAILDFKTGSVRADEARSAARAWYQPQLDRYAEGVAALFGIAPDSIETGLLFVE